MLYSLNQINFVNQCKSNQCELLNKIEHYIVPVSLAFRQMSFVGT